MPLDYSMGRYEMPKATHSQEVDQPNKKNLQIISDSRREYEMAMDREDYIAANILRHEINQGVQDFLDNAPKIQNLVKAATGETPPQLVYDSLSEEQGQVISEARSACDEALSREDFVAANIFFQEFITAFREAYVNIQEQERSVLEGNTMTDPLRGSKISGFESFRSPDAEPQGKRKRGFFKKLLEAA